MAINNNYHFVISAPRSGSTWLSRALNQHPDILATENRLFGDFCELWQGPNGRTTPRITADKYFSGLSRHSFHKDLGFENPIDLATDLQGEYFKFLKQYLKLRSGKSVIVDKITPYLGTAKKVLARASAIEDAKLIQLIRDGRDVAVSGVFDWIARENLNSDRHRLFVEGDSNVQIERFFEDELLERWARYWIEPMDAFIDSNCKSLEIRYESMLADHPRALQSIFDFIEVRADLQTAEQCADKVTFARTTGRPAGDSSQLSKSRKGISGDWKNYFTKQDARLFQTLTAQHLQRLGYATDESWVDDCPDSLNLTADTLP